MVAEIKTCQNCKNQFNIETDDLDFYKKINVPTPTWCPECRLMRRLTFRNIRNLYKRNCNLSGKPILSIYSRSDLNIIDYKTWFSDDYDPNGSGANYDFSKSFFAQFGELLIKTPLSSVMAINRVDSDYTSNTAEVKNCYLIFNGEGDNNCSYGKKIFFSKDCVDNLYIYHSELCYENINSRKCYRSTFLDTCVECSNSFFCYDCKNCSDILFSHGLRNKKYCVFNKEYTKEGYKEIKEKLITPSYSNLKYSLDKFSELKNKAIRRPAIYHSVSSTGEDLTQCKNCRTCFESDLVENSKYVTFVDHDLKDSMDITNWQVGELSYECMACGRGSRISFSVTSWDCRDITYSMFNIGCSNLFGCIGLRNKQYCILNKQYTKEEYEKLVPKIIEHTNTMPYQDSKGRIYKYGEFFPIEISPFAYNETAAQDYFYLSKHDADLLGYKWKDPEEKNYQITIKSEDLPDNIKDVNDSILNQIIECSHVSVDPTTNQSKSTCLEQCTTAFKIIPQELQFYKQMNLPLPRLCPNCRHYQRLKQRNPLKLWKRSCMCSGKNSQLSNSNFQHKNVSDHSHGDLPCPNEFETSYNPNRPEIVYCESCYNNEVA